MKLIGITNPSDYFQFTTNFGNDVWRFLFRWNETYSLFHVDCYLNGQPQVLSIAVRGGRFVLDDFSLGYNFFFYGTDPQAPTDLGNTLQMYQVLTAEAQQAGLILNGSD